MSGAVTTNKERLSVSKLERKEGVELLDTALDAAHRAGELLLERLDEPRNIRSKGYRDIVTDVDTAAEEIILSIIRRRHPDHAILSEEAGQKPAEGQITWVVDPLDGTTNYSRGHPTFSVSVAALKQGRTLAGVVLDPVRGHTFAACRGGGATLNGQPIQTSAIERIEKALVGLDWARSDEDRRKILRRLDILAPRCRTLRGLGSAALAQTYIGVGWVDVYFGAGMYPWDVAASNLIATEAGGHISGFHGEPWQVGQPDLLITNGHLHETVLELWGELGGE